jgi:uncharacterized protein (TIGR02271 family)
LTVPFTKDQIKAAPNMAPDQDLSQEEESRLYAHYGVSYSDAPSPSGLPETGQGMTGRESRDMGDFESGQRRNDDAMTRSEEQVRVGTEQVQTGVARLRKYVETEQVNVPVTVSKEKVRLETEPITDANRDDAMAGPEISEGEHEVTLTEERPVVAKETVPVERVRLEKDTVTEEQNVSETVRKERIATDGVDDVYPEEPGVPQTDRNLR